MVIERAISTMYPLEQFYYGQLIHHGQTKGQARVLARSQGIQDEHVQVALAHAAIPAHPQIADLSWAIVRGNKSAPFILSQAERTEAGTTSYRFILLTTEIYRSLQGNLIAFKPFLESRIPVYDRLGDTLPALNLDPAKLETAEQVDLLLDLLTYTKDKPRDVLQPLLSCIVKGVPLVVVNGPEDSAQRWRFVQGLMTLLPSSTRFGVTFATYLTDETAYNQINSQIAFREGRIPEGVAVYDWASGSVSGNVIVEDYSRFIVSQLRLDTTLAIEQAEALTPVAGWRYRSGETLAGALAYASKRSKYDRALENNMPVQVDEVARILAEDVTLNDRLKVMYAGHLLTMSLALDNTKHLDVLAPILMQTSSFSQQARQQLTDKLNNGKQGALIYEAMRRWFELEPELAKTRWSAVLQQSALAASNEYIEREDTDALKTFLSQLQTSDAEQLKRVVPQLLQRLIPLLKHYPEFSTPLLLLAIQYLDTSALKRILSTSQFTRQLAPTIKRYLHGVMTTESAKPGDLLSAVGATAKHQRIQALLQFVSLSLRMQKASQISTTVLKALVRTLGTSDAQRQRPILVRAAQAKAEDTRQAADTEAARYIMQLLLAGQVPEALAHEMMQQSLLLYGGERQGDYVQSVYTAFSETPITTIDALHMLNAISAHKVRDIPLIAAGCGLLVSTKWSPEMQPVAERSIQRLEENPLYLAGIHPELVLELLRFYLKDDLNSAEAHIKRVMDLIPTVAAHKDARVGLAAINDMYKLMRHDSSKRDMAFVAICQYIREADDKPAQRAMGYFGKEYGTDASARLRVAFTFSRMMGKRDLIAYSNAMHTTVEWLIYTNAYYLPRAKAPSIAELTTAVHNIRAGIDVRYRVEFAEALRNLAKAVVLLGDEQQKQGRGRRNAEAIVRGNDEARCTLDVLRAAGGTFARNIVYNVRTQASEASEIFKGLRPSDLYEQVVVTTDVLQSLITAVSTEGHYLTHAEIQQEVAALRGADPSDDLREATKSLAADCQYVAELVTDIFRDGNKDAVEDGSRIGKKLDARSQQPRNVLEMYRLVYAALLDTD
jgi:hypothetical protein